MKKAISFIIIVSLMIVSLSSGQPLKTASANTASLKKAKLQTFTTGAMEFYLSVASVSNGVAVTVEGDPDDKTGGYNSHRIVLIDYETGKKVVTKYDTFINYDGDSKVATFVEGWAIVGKVGGVKQNAGEMGYTFIDPNGKSLTEPTFAYLTDFKNGLAGCRYYVGDDCYTGILQTDGKVKFAIFGRYDVTIGNNYVSMGNFTYDYNGNRITLTSEILEKDYPNYKASERKSFYKNYASKYTNVEYLGSDRFRVENESSSKIVDSNNKTILTEKERSYYPCAYVNNNKLYIESSKGIHNKDGKLIISREKYEEIRPADGDCFATKLKDKFQMFDSSGKEIAVSNYNPMIFLYQGRADTIFNWNLDSEYRPTGMACLYTNIDLSKKSSTSELSKLYKKCKLHDSSTSDRGLRDNAQKLMKNSTAANPGLFAVMSQLSLRIYGY